MEEENLKLDHKPESYEQKILVLTYDVCVIYFDRNLIPCSL